MKTFITDIEDQVEQTLLKDMGREVGVVAIHSDNVEDVAWHLRSNQYDYGKYPYILFYCGLADTIADDTTTLMPTVSITLTAYVVYAEDGENYRYNQKRVCEHTGLRAWTELAQRRFGSDITSQEPMTGFTLQREINAEELAMWRLEGELNINVDLNELYQINNAGSFSYRVSASSHDPDPVEARVFGPARDQLTTWTIQDVISGRVIDVLDTTDFSYDEWVEERRTYRITASFAQENLEGVARIHSFAGGRDDWGTSDTNWDAIPDQAVVSTVSESDPRTSCMTIVVDTSLGSSDLQDIAIPLRDDVAYDMEVLWNPGTTPSFAETTRIDGQLDPVTIEGVELTPFRPVQHTYDDVYRGQIKIAGRMPRWAYANQPDSIDGTAVSRKDALIAVERWADLEWSNFREAFSGCSELITTGAGVFFDEGAQQWFADQLIEGYRPAPVGSMERCFASCPSYGATGDACGIAGWDVNGVTNIGSLFRGAETFNQNLNGWHFGGRVDIIAAFRGASSFNNGFPEGDAGILDWHFEVGRVTTNNFTLAPFRNCAAFNQNINGLDFSSADSDRRGMFSGCSSFNNGGFPLDMDFSNAVRIERFFSRCTSFNNGDAPGETSEFYIDVKNAVDLNGFFRQCSVFNQDISQWNVSAALDLSGFLRGCAMFNQDISKKEVTRDGVTYTAWDTSNVENIAVMFNGASVFNQDISNWDVSNVQSMLQMFSFSGINQDLSAWDVSSVETFGQGPDRQDQNFAVGATDWDVAKIDAMLDSWASKVNTNVPIGNEVQHIGFDISLDGQFGSGKDAMCAAGVDVRVANNFSAPGGISQCS